KKQREEATKLRAEKRKRDEEEIQMMNEKLAAIGYGPLARRPSQDQNEEVIGESKEEHDSSSSAQLLSVSITNVSIFRANVTPSVLVTEAPEPAPDQIEAEIKESGGSVFRANL
ncbi:MAG: hypothetical protein P4L31_00335, partial [Candidatus Babeliales bacterium]|nr:hypothetical protein [Candidatus Babeliales bacterium]